MMGMVKEGVCVHLGELVGDERLSQLVMLDGCVQSLTNNSMNAE